MKLLSNKTMKEGMKRAATWNQRFSVLTAILYRLISEQGGPASLETLEDGVESFTSEDGSILTGRGKIFSVFSDGGRTDGEAFIFCIVSKKLLKED